MGCGGLGALERRRAALMLGEVVPPPARRPRPDRLGARLWSVVTDGTRWREMGAAILAGPVVVVGFSVAVTVWSVALALMVLPAYNSALPRGEPTPSRLDSAWPRSCRGRRCRCPPGAVGALGHPVHGLVATMVGPQVARADPAPSLAVRVGDLERSRSRMVVAADADRRRIERDLHDGAQARLVSVAMELGRAKARFADDPEAAKA